MKAENFFSSQDKERIAEAVRQVELRTSGEVVVLVVDESDTYPEGRILAGGVLGGVAALVVTDFWLADNLWRFVPLALGLTAFSCWLVGWLPFLHRLFVHPARLEGQVAEQALVAFYQKGLYKTRDATGVLFFISLFEHKVRILADQGIYEKISQETLQEYATDVALGVRDGNATEALCREIGRVGEILARHFPIAADDTNELSNEVLVGR
jgi:putative membrane protein